MDYISQYLGEMYNFNSYIEELDYWLERIRKSNNDLKGEIGVASKKFIFQAIECFICLGVVMERAMAKHLFEERCLTETRRKNISFYALTELFYQNVKNVDEQEVKSERIKIDEIRAYRNIGAHGQTTRLADLLKEEVEQIQADNLLEKKQKFLIEKIDTSINFVDQFITKYLQRK